MFLIQITTVDGKEITTETESRDDAVLRSHDALKSGVRVAFKDAGFWQIPPHGIAHVRVVPKEETANDSEVPEGKPKRKTAPRKRAAKK